MPVSLPIKDRAIYGLSPELCDYKTLVLGHSWNASEQRFPKLSMGIHSQVAHHHGSSHEGRQKNLHFWSVRSKYTKSSSLALLILAPCFVFLLIPADLDPWYLWRSRSLHLPEQLRFHVLYLGIYLGYSIFNSLASSLYSIISSILAWKPHGQRVFFQRPLQLRETDLPNAASKWWVFELPEN